MSRLLLRDNEVHQITKDRILQAVLVVQLHQGSCACSNIAFKFIMDDDAVKISVGVLHLVLVLLL